MSLLKKLKTVVAPSIGKRATDITVSQPVKKSNFIKSVNKVISSVNGEPKEWHCPCGHKFWDSGEWMVCAPALCEVPSCPNKRYYIDGPGRALLEANPSGISMKSAASSLQKQELKGKTPGGIGSRIH